MYTFLRVNKLFLVAEIATYIFGIILTHTDLRLKAKSRRLVSVV